MHVGNSITGAMQGPRKNIIMDVCIFILVMELAERLCFFTFVGSINIYLRDYLGYKQAIASAMASAFNTMVYLTPLIGGYIADAYWGRYNTIAVFGMFYLAGTSLMALSSVPGHEMKALFMFAFFGLVSLGAGGIKSNVVTMGGDQFNLEHDIESKQKDTYFTYFYFVINVGAIFSYFVMAQIAIEPEEFGFAAGSGFFVTFVISASALGLALLVFFSASSRYIYRKPSGSATARYCEAIWRTSFGDKSSESEGHRSLTDIEVLDISAEKEHASNNRIKSSDNSGSGGGSLKGKCLVFGVFINGFAVMIGIIQPFILQEHPQAVMSYVAFIVATLSILLICIPTVGTPHWVEAKGGKAAMLATRVIPVLFNTVSFQVVYAAMNYFALSACQMDVGISFLKQRNSNIDDDSSGDGGDSVFQINASMLNAADCIAIIIVVPLLDYYIYPKVDKYLGRKCKCSEKYMVGLFIGILAICFAALFEVIRRNSPKVPACHQLHHKQHHHNDVNANSTKTLLSPTASPTWTPSLHTDEDDEEYYIKNSACYSMCASPGVEMSSFSVWWMAIPFFLVGVGECLCNIPILDVCYSQTPPAFRSLAQAISLFVTAIGNMFTGAFTTTLSAYITNDLNDGHLEYFYYFCILFCCLLIPINLWCFSLFEELDEKEIEGLSEDFSLSSSSSDKSIPKERGGESADGGGTRKRRIKVVKGSENRKGKGKYDDLTAIHDNDDDSDEYEEEEVGIRLNTIGLSNNSSVMIPSSSIGGARNRANNISYHEQFLQRKMHQKELTSTINVLHDVFHNNHDSDDDEANEEEDDESDEIDTYARVSRGMV